MRWLWIISVILLLPGAAGSAQDRGTWRLRTPDLAEYLTKGAALANLIWGTNEDSARSTMVEELELRYGLDALKEQPYQQVAAFYTNLFIGPGYAMYDTDRSAWVQGILTGWLRDEQIDLDSGMQFETEFFRVDVTPVDFSGDGRAEYVLTLQAYSIHYLFVAEGFPNNYRLLSPNLPLGDTPGFGRFTGAYTVEFHDLNGDGKAEWILQSRWRHYAQCWQFWVLTWQDGHFMDVADDEFFSCRDESYDMDGEVLPEFRNEGASVTFVVETWNYDGWGCRWNERDEIRWDGAQFTYERIDPRPMNAYCLLSQANDAFEKGSYRQAANLFAQIDSSEFADTTSPSPNVAVEQLSQYIAARRALALAFDKNLSEARTVLGDIQPNGTMGRLVIQLRQASAFSDAWGMCDTIYHFFERINDTAWQENGYVDPFAWRPVSMTWGALDTVSGPGWDLPSPYSAGCKTIVDTRYAIARLRADQSVMPLQQLWRDFEQLRSSGHYSAALDMLGSIATDPNFNPASSAYVSYWRAVLLELSGHTDEAIADYLDLYNADPINAWGQLAILHLEWVPG